MIIMSTYLGGEQSLTYQHGYLGLPTKDAGIMTHRKRARSDSSGRRVAKS